MKLSRKPSHAERGGFTLIELLIVITIIGILIALTAAAVMRTLILGPQTTARYDISQFDSSTEAFKATGGYNQEYLPSRIILRKFLVDYFDASGNPLSQLDLDSVMYLTKMFGGSGQKFKTTWTTTGINWQTSWSAVVKSPGPGEMLEGDQCLVFFLGGIQTTDANGTKACLGFSTNNAQPDQVGGDRKSFYEFKGGRLYVRRGTFFSYQDAYGKGQPYAYFCAYARDNNYNRYDANNNYAGSNPKVPTTSDCSSLGVWPYAESNTPAWRYLKPKTHQIICAGADGKFGPGTDITLPAGPPPAGPLMYTSTTLSFLPPMAQDDQANFAANKLLAGQ